MLMLCCQSATPRCSAAFAADSAIAYCLLRFSPDTPAAEGRHLLLPERYAKAEDDAADVILMLRQMS
jgi:hypothetical protein